MTRSKTIQIFLKDADPNGIKIAELSNSTVKVYVIPRKDVSFTQNRIDLNNPSIYFLFDDERTSVYIGECENFNARIKHHELNKEFWQWVVVVVSSDASLDKADVKFLESHSVLKAVETGRYEVRNQTNPSKNQLHEFKQETILDFFDNVELLLGTLGFNLFEPIQEEVQVNEDKTEKIPSTDERDFDTIIGPARDDGRIKAFEEKNAWWAVRIGQSIIPRLKYVGLYEVAPVSAIRYYAKIRKIEPFEDSPGKYIIYHDGNIQELENHVELGDTPQLALYGPRYYKLEDIKNSKTMAELTNKAFGSNY